METLITVDNYYHYYDNGVTSKENKTFVFKFIKEYCKQNIESDKQNLFKEKRINELTDVKVWFNSEKQIFIYDLKKLFKFREGKYIKGQWIKYHKEFSVEEIAKKIDTWITHEPKKQIQ